MSRVYLSVFFVQQKTFVFLLRKSEFFLFQIRKYYPKYRIDIENDLLLASSFPNYLKHSISDPMIQKEDLTIQIKMKRCSFED